ncbi:MAG: hypothetical protein RR487_06665 [Acinetobacter sp.]
MPNVNKAIVMGVLGRDPETKNFPINPKKGEKVYIDGALRTKK